MQLFALNPDITPASPIAPDEPVWRDGGLARLDCLRAALRRTRVASALRADMRLVSDLHGLPALEALCVRLAILLGRPLRSFAPGTEQAHFDEAWLLGIFDAVSRDDPDSYAFLLRTRLSRAEASEVHLLVCRAKSAFQS